MRHSAGLLGDGAAALGALFRRLARPLIGMPCEAIVNGRSGGGGQRLRLPMSCDGRSMPRA
jgi:hypothetical protein